MALPLAAIAISCGNDKELKPNKNVPPSFSTNEVSALMLHPRNFISGLTLFSVYEIPEKNQEWMYIFDFEDLYRVNGNKPQPTVLKTKIRFTE